MVSGKALFGLVYIIFSYVAFRELSIIRYSLDGRCVDAHVRECARTF